MDPTVSSVALGRNDTLAFAEQSYVLFPCDLYYDEQCLCWYSLLFMFTNSGRFHRGGFMDTRIVEEFLNNILWNILCEIEKCAIHFVPFVDNISFPSQVFPSFGFYIFFVQRRGKRLCVKTINRWGVVVKTVRALVATRPKRTRSTRPHTKKPLVHLSSPSFRVKGAWWESFIEWVGESDRSCFFRRSFTLGLRLVLILFREQTRQVL